MVMAFQVLGFTSKAWVKRAGSIMSNEIFAFDIKVTRCVNAGLVGNIADFNHVNMVLLSRYIVWKSG